MHELTAQSYDLPPSPQAGKCYVRCFDYDKKFEWKETNCKELNENRNKKRTPEEILAVEQGRLKMQAYQAKLKDLGYNVDITGVARDKTIIAHHKYLKKKAKIKRKANRRKMGKRI